MESVSGVATATSLSSQEGVAGAAKKYFSAALKSKA